MTDININDINYKKYLKYKFKYLELKQSGGGALFSSSSLTEKTLKYFKNAQTKYDPKKYLDYVVLSITFHKIPNLITDLKTDLTNVKSTFNQLLLDEFVTLPIFNKISLDYKKEEITKVNFLINFEIIQNMWKEQLNNNKSSKEVLKEFNGKITIFLNELITYINQNFEKMEYKKELLDILTIYLNNVKYCFEEEITKILNRYKLPQNR